MASYTRIFTSTSPQVLRQSGIFYARNYGLKKIRGASFQLSGTVQINSQVTVACVATPGTNGPVRDQDVVITGTLWPISAIPPKVGPAPFINQFWNYDFPTASMPTPIGNIITAPCAETDAISFFITDGLITSFATLQIIFSITDEPTTYYSA